MNDTSSQGSTANECNCRTPFSSAPANYQTNEIFSIRINQEA